MPLSTPKKLLFLILNYQLSIINYSVAQLPLGAWQTHFSYQSINGLAVVGSNVYAASKNGFFYFDAADNQLQTLSTQNNLSETGVSALAFSPAARVLVLGYESGNVDVLSINANNRPAATKNISVIKNATQISGSKRINQVVVQGNNAFLAGDFGVALLDLSRNEIRETYRNIGAQGAAVAVKKLVFANDSIYALTSAGLRKARFAATVNLQFFGNWRTVETPAVFSLLVASDKQLFGAENRQVWQYVNGRWTPFLRTNTPITSLNFVGGQLAVGEVGKVEIAGVTFTDPQLNNPVEVLAEGGNFWVATSQNGLLRLQNRTVQSFTPTGPQFDVYQRINAANGSIFALSGQNSQTGFDSFTEQKWTPFQLPRSATAAVFSEAEQRVFVASFSEGVFGQNTNKTFDRLPNSPANATGMATDRDGNLWVCAAPSAFNAAGLFLRRRDGTWQSFALARRQFTQILVDDNGFKWLVVSPFEGGGLLVFDDKINRSRFLSTAQGAGGLPDFSINDLAKDRDGAIWTATNRGVAVFDNPAGVFNSGFNAFLPVFQQKRLLSNEIVTAVAVDGANRKWLGTPNGLFRFGADGSELFERFTVENSPLPSNFITDIAIEPISGEVFVLTDKGIVSYGGLANEPENSLSKISVFPNPVRPEFEGLLTIKGLTENAVVKITDMAGRLVHETRSQGGTASWNLLNYQGRRAETGVYLILVADAQGNESLAGKVAIVR